MYKKRHAQKGTKQIQQVTQVTISIYVYEEEHLYLIYIDIVPMYYTCSLFLIACNERAVVDKTVNIDGSIQMEFIIKAGRFTYKIISAN